MMVSSVTGTRIHTRQPKDDGRDHIVLLGELLTRFLKYRELTPNADCLAGLSECAVLRQSLKGVPKSRDRHGSADRMRFNVNFHGHFGSRLPLWRNDQFCGFQR